MALSLPGSPRGCGRRCAAAPSRWHCSCSCFRFGGPASERDASPNALRQRRRSMMSNARCWKQQLAVLAIAMGLLSGCATVGSDMCAVSTCPSPVDYSREFQARAADEVAVLSEDSAIAVMLSDYAVMRDQAGTSRSRRGWSAAIILEDERDHRATELESSFSITGPVISPCWSTQCGQRRPSQRKPDRSLFA